MSEPVRGYPRTAGFRLWLERRHLRAVKKDTTVIIEGHTAMRCYNGGGAMNKGMTPSQILRLVQDNNPGKTPAYVRAINKDTGRCIVIMFLDDLVPLWAAKEELEHRE